jgi:geranylgeranyl pyrophosphate synthase
LIDDVLDFTGTSASLGKGSLSDIRHVMAALLFLLYFICNVYYLKLLFALQSSNYLEYRLAAFIRAYIHKILLAK